MLMIAVGFATVVGSRLHIDKECVLCTLSTRNIIIHLIHCHEKQFKIVKARPIIHQEGRLSKLQLGSTLLFDNINEYQISDQTRMISELRVQLFSIISSHADS